MGNKKLIAACVRHENLWFVGDTHNNANKNKSKILYFNMKNTPSLEDLKEKFPESFFLNLGDKIVLKENKKTVIFVEQKETSKRDVLSDGEDGFLDEDGNFFNREKAVEVAINHNQLKDNWIDDEISELHSYMVKFHQEDAEEAAA